jgi:hypothetical protein
MQTVIKELIDELNELSNDYYKLSEYDTCHGIGIAVEFIMTKLEKEKEQIRLAFREGHEYWGELTSDMYYDQTYNQ